jgi:tetratricopeptide (TPR) repeat protein
MPTIKKRSQAAKKQPEQQIVTWAHLASDFYARNRKFVMIAVSILAIALLLGGGFVLNRSLDEQKAGPLFDSAYERYSPASGSRPDYAAALGLFKDVQKKYPSTLSGAMAGLYAGNCLMNMGRADEALQEYQSFITGYKNEELLTGLAYERMGYLYAGMGKQAEAIKAFKQAEALSGPGAASIELARLYEASGNAAESQKEYKMIADKLAGTSWGVEAMGKVQKIESAPASVSPQGDASKQTTSGKSK